MLEKKLMPIDTVVAMVQYLSIYYCNEIKRGWCNIGEFKLLPEFIKFKHEKSELEGVIRPTLGPTELIRHLNSNREEMKIWIIITIGYSKRLK